MQRQQCCVHKYPNLLRKLFGEWTKTNQPKLLRTSLIIWICRSICIPLVTLCNIWNILIKHRNLKVYCEWRGCVIPIYFNSDRDVIWFAVYKPYCRFLHLLFSRIEKYSSRISSRTFSQAQPNQKQAMEGPCINNNYQCSKYHSAC